MNMRCPYKVTRNTTTIDKTNLSSTTCPTLSPSFPPQYINQSFHQKHCKLHKCAFRRNLVTGIITPQNNPHLTTTITELCVSCCCLLELLHNNLLTLSYSLLQFLLISDSIPPTKQSDQNQHQRLYIYCCCGWSLSLSYV